MGLKLKAWNITQYIDCIDSELMFPCYLDTIVSVSWERTLSRWEIQ